MTNIKYMELANELAYEAYNKNEVPIGCVIVYNDIVIGKGYNTREHTNNVLGHAELNAIKEASSFLNTWKLDDCVMYVTVEPCIMCYGAIIQSRIKKVYVGSIQDKIKPSSYKRYISDDDIIDESLINELSGNLMIKFFKKMRS